jgi:hypothetical protein
MLLLLAESLRVGPRIADPRPGEASEDDSGDPYDSDVRGDGCAEGGAGFNEVGGDNYRLRAPACSQVARSVRHHPNFRRGAVYYFLVQWQPFSLIDMPMSAVGCSAPRAAAETHKSACVDSGAPLVIPLSWSKGRSSNAQPLGILPLVANKRSGHTA